MSAPSANLSVYLHGLSRPLLLVASPPSSGIPTLLFKEQYVISGSIDTTLPSGSSLHYSQFEEATLATINQYYGDADVRVSQQWGARQGWPLAPTPTTLVITP